MNPFEELQSYQQPAPSVGPALMGQPQPAQAQAQGMGPPASPEEYQQRVQGWSTALGELIKQPEVAVALMQMGTALGSGRTGSDGPGSETWRLETRSDSGTRWG